MQQFAWQCRDAHAGVFQCTWAATEWCFRVYRRYYYQLECVYNWRLSPSLRAARAGMCRPFWQAVTHLITPVNANLMIGILS